MKKIVLVLFVSLLSLVFVGSAMAVPFNTRPVPGLSNLDALQLFLNSKDPGIDVYNDQNGAAIWSTSPSNNSTFTIMLEMAGWAGTNKVGLYNDGDTSTLFEVFSGVAAPGWKALVSFNAGGIAGKVVATVLDEFSAFKYQNTYFGVNSGAFGWYLDATGAGQQQSQIVFSEDDENAQNTAQNLVYESPTGTGWWICFEDQARWISSDSDFTDFVIFAESVRPVPEPATMILVGSGLLGLAGVGRKKFFKKG